MSNSLAFDLLFFLNVFSIFSKGKPENIKILNSDNITWNVECIVCCSLEGFVQNPLLSQRHIVVCSFLFLLKNTSWQKGVKVNNDMDFLIVYT